MLVHLLLAWRLRGFVTDDSWITVRYAENLAAGAGEDVLKALRAVPVEEYANAAEVARSVPAEEEATDPRAAAEQARGQATSRVAAGERPVPPDPTDV
ncbi:DUF2795 domain-containing protein [Kineococcus sp. T13]|nr:DUF2795 domain-containing protein [Kineococcus vitellinus]